MQVINSYSKCFGCHVAMAMEDRVMNVSAILISFLAVSSYKNGGFIILKIIIN